MAVLLPLRRFYRQFNGFYHYGSVFSLSYHIQTTKELNEPKKTGALA